ncbi:eukaryotic translation elongation factor 1 epsilon-1-like [Tubulanus polymorphus]|uniref:eukaryotic translation elongation factor 1 epsilon-1-like n=1 Tax=Tubulanus polymorphus TaxID=672921 RepID=UPI003DA4BFB4
MAEIQNFAEYLSISLKNASLQNGDQGLAFSSKECGKIQGLATIYKHIAKQGKEDLLGKTIKEQTFISQWLEYRVKNLDKALINERIPHDILKELNGYLADRTFFIGHQISLADIVLFYGLHNVMGHLTFFDKQKYMHLSRWFQQMQFTDRLRQNNPEISFQRNYLYNIELAH